jgi:hypothetical protein
VVAKLPRPPLPQRCSPLAAVPVGATASEDAAPWSRRRRKRQTEDAAAQTEAKAKAAANTNVQREEARKIFKYLQPVHVNAGQHSATSYLCLKTEARSPRMVRGSPREGALCSLLRPR